MNDVDIEGARADLKTRCDSIEEAYEFFLAYASQGLSSDQNSSHPIRDHLRRFDAALTGIRGFLDNCVVRLGLDVGRAAAAKSFIEILERDAASAQSAIRLVLAQPKIGSQTIDNLNA
ncbi:MAG TPA: hypothetical protein VGY57_16315, partial [Vicinamibacterales bacterium]|nr:hypothetical protein [Vicinamibacterales bacterium]